jgi:putative CocE/NonD family hydrolase
VADRIFASALLLREPAARVMGASVPGVAPVDDDDGTLVRQHLQERAGNLNVAKASATMEFRDDTNLSPHDPDLSIDTFSPHSYVDRLKGAGAAVYHYSGWFDGAYQLSAIKRFHQFDGANDQLILGPWEHSGRQNISPWEPSREPLFDHDAELIAFFDQHLLTDSPGEIAAPEQRVRYYVMGSERWKSAPTWPPPGVRMQQWYIGPSQTLTTDRNDRVDTDARVLVAGRHGTGLASRWRSLLPMLSLTHYTERSGPDIATFTSSPLTADLEVVGHPILKVKMSSTSTDPRLFVYLEDVTPNGEIHYVTEGLLRARDRREKRNKPVSHKDIPYHSFKRADAQSVNPGEVFTMTMDLLPTAYLFRKDHSLRLTFAGQDADHFELGPNGTHHIELGACSLGLPVAE